MKCPSCGEELKNKTGKFGDFIGCSNFPKCKYSEKIKVSNKVSRSMHDYSINLTLKLMEDDVEARHQSIGTGYADWPSDNEDEDDDAWARIPR